MKQNSQLYIDLKTEKDMLAKKKGQELAGAVIAHKGSEQEN